jgi:hypothetical protein
VATGNGKKRKRRSEAGPGGKSGPKEGEENMNLCQMSAQQLEQYETYCRTQENLQAVVEIADHRKYYGQRVEVIKGRKVPVGTVGKVFFVKRVNYGRDQWTGWATRIGFQTNAGETYFTNASNLRIAE